MKIASGTSPFLFLTALSAGRRWTIDDAGIAAL